MLVRVTCHESELNATEKLQKKVFLKIIRINKFTKIKKSKHHENYNSKVKRAMNDERVGGYLKQTSNGHCGHVQMCITILLDRLKRT